MPLPSIYLPLPHTSAYGSIRQHTLAYVSVCSRTHTSTCKKTRTRRQHFCISIQHCCTNLLKYVAFLLEYTHLQHLRIHTHMFIRAASLHTYTQLHAAFLHKYAALLHKYIHLQHFCIVTHIFTGACITIHATHSQKKKCGCVRVHIEQ